MDVIEAIKTRRAVRAWTEEDIADDLLTQILEAGRWSPSPLNSQPWHFTIVKNRDTIDALCKDAREGSFLRMAKVVVVISVDRAVITPSDSQNEERVALIKWLAEHDQYVYSATCALQNMWLAAWSLNLGGCWVTVDKNATYGLLNIPQEQEIVGSLALGRILGVPVPHNENNRKPLSEMVFYEKYGVKEKSVDTQA